MKRRGTFNYCGERSNCELIIERMFEVHGKILNIIYFYKYLKEWSSEDGILKTSYSENDHTIFGFCFQ